ncbi:sensor domain-containing diguanylate cyclase [Methylosinus sp. H3A]|uniref:sensor domain-containing diguanylate cyclase n=1 Tax=Methylosinus sp. H3A TaxID=2785786 RepID=UPI001AEF2818|nr:sensor domain-containing diguanylate cyclase [Methylosinus sp. H3A]
MRETISAFFDAQLDFIFFFYGLAFLLLGAICFAVAGEGPRRAGWVMLGLFGYAHGAVEWLDLLALVIGDGFAFEFARKALMTASYLLLLEFARSEAVAAGDGKPGRWIHVPLALIIIVVAAVAGLASAAAVARYMIGFVGALGAALVFAGGAPALAAAARPYAYLAAAGFALYAFCAGLVVAPAPFWPASALNSDRFVAVTGVPIQLLRGLLACVIAFSVWSIRQHQLAQELSSRRFADYLRRQFVWTIAAMMAILLCGWGLTDFLGAVYQRNVQAETRSDLDLLASRFVGETAALSGMAATLAGAPSVRPTGEGEAPQANEAARATLQLHVDASGAERGLLLDASGGIVASAAASGEKAPIGGDYASHRSFREAIGGVASRCMTYDSTNRDVVYHASAPIRDTSGGVVGVAVLGKPLVALQADLRRFDRPYFLLDSDGVVAMTNRDADMSRPMWPLSTERLREAERRYGALDDRPLLERELGESNWVALEGEQGYIRRRFIDTEGWSVAIATPTREIFASRVLGIIVTLLVTMMTLIYLIGQERRLQDGIQMEKRLRLQELARDLGQQAVTDRLTGLFNRLKFDQALASEMLRSQRYGVPLSLVLFDVDNFKAINDSHGHQTGDRALVRLAEAAAKLVRGSDILARWGGEEFALLTPGVDGSAALKAAEKLRASIERLGVEEIDGVTCSFGVTQFTPDDSAEEFVGRADEALYLAKLRGRNRVEMVSRSPASGGLS